ncbi:hypothetical protein ACIP5N_05000 [Streptomyces sp. NPDC088768]|uniref:hypothetical protein n=1 Tax=Streptomyces sp. NPDC088768 TaxID=3365894 RepID=UPI000B84CA17
MNRSTVFEIRIICAPTDADRVTHELAAAFRTGEPRTYPARDGRTRVYVTAEVRGPEWPTPEEAYEGAPDIIDALAAVTAIAAGAECFTRLDRAYYLRKAAVLDRIALGDGADWRDDLAAEAAADHFLDVAPAPAPCDPRAYVRQQYARWAATASPDPVR